VARRTRCCACTSCHAAAPVVAAHDSSHRHLLWDCSGCRQQQQHVVRCEVAAAAAVLLSTAAAAAVGVFGVYRCAAATAATVAVLCCAISSCWASSKQHSSQYFVLLQQQLEHRQDWLHWSRPCSDSCCLCWFWQHTHFRVFTQVWSSSFCSALCAPAAVEAASDASPGPIWCISDVRASGTCCTRGHHLAFSRLLFCNGCCVPLRRGCSLLLEALESVLARAQQCTLLCCQCSELCGIICNGVSCTAVLLQYCLPIPRCVC